MWRVELCNLNKTTLLKQCSRLKTRVICLKVREGQLRVPALARVLLLVKVNREGSDDLGKVSLAVLCGRNRKEWAKEVSRHQRRPSVLISKSGDPSLHVVPD